MSSRNHRFGKFYDSLCCLCATKRGFDLTIAGHGGACRVCLAKNVTDLHSQPHLHLDALCAKLSRMVYNMSNAVRSQLSGHFEILAEISKIPERNANAPVKLREKLKDIEEIQHDVFYL